MLRGNIKIRFFPNNLIDASNNGPVTSDHPTPKDHPVHLFPRNVNPTIKVLLDVSLVKNWKIFYKKTVSNIITMRILVFVLQYQLRPGNSHSQHNQDQNAGSLASKHSFTA